MGIVSSVLTSQVQIQFKRFQYVRMFENNKKNNLKWPGIVCFYLDLSIIAQTFSVNISIPLWEFAARQMLGPSMQTQASLPLAALNKISDRAPTSISSCIVALGFNMWLLKGHGFDSS